MQFTYRVTYLNGTEFNQIMVKGTNLLDAILNTNIPDEAITGIQNTDITPELLAKANA